MNSFYLRPSTLHIATVALSNSTVTESAGKLLLFAQLTTARSGDILPEKGAFAESSVGAASVVTSATPGSFQPAMLTLASRPRVAALTTSSRSCERSVASCADTESALASPVRETASAPGSHDSWYIWCTYPGGWSQLPRNE